MKKNYCLFLIIFIVSGLTAQNKPAAHKEMEQTDTGIASRYRYDEDIQKDPSVIFATGFENGFEIGRAHV